jgi:uncharacterized protein (TIGR00375 family)
VKEYFVDLHVHIGRDSRGRPVKVSGARDLTLENIAREAAERKGIDIIGVVDCASGRVLSDIDLLSQSGAMEEAPGGGMRYKGTTVIVPGVEIEASCRAGEGLSAHYVAYFATLPQVREAARELSRHTTNIDLSTQKTRLAPEQLARLVGDMGGLFVVAHAFTPHKSLYGTCARRIDDVFGEEARRLVTAMELGLSADTGMADRIAELASYTFLSNSDAHSLGRMGREYNVMRLESPSFAEVSLALARIDGRRVVANYGLDPRLGKYYMSACQVCGARFRAPNPAVGCPECGASRIVRGVSDRVDEIADSAEAKSPAHRPPYLHQVPLQFVPGVGQARIARLIRAFGSEMAVLHRATRDQLAEAAGEHIADRIVAAREGRLAIQAGGGGTYGRTLSD